MALKIKTVTVGMMQTNCYIVYDDAAKESKDGARACVIVDPGAQAEKIQAACEAAGVRPEAILLTHGHFDHIMAVDGLRKKYPGIPVYAAEAESALLLNPENNLSGRFETAVTIEGVHYLKDGEKLDLIGHSFEVIATPGHTIGGCCYYAADAGVLFAGDTLFHESYGRTDLATGDMSALVRSIAEKLMQLPDETVVYPGHEEETTIGHERKYNICNVIYQRDCGK